MKPETRTKFGAGALVRTFAVLALVLSSVNCEADETELHDEDLASGLIDEEALDASWLDLPVGEGLRYWSQEAFRVGEGRVDRRRLSDRQQDLITFG